MQMKHLGQTNLQLGHEGMTHIFRN